MIRLKVPLMWDGHLIPAGNTVVLPEKMEKNLVSAGNGLYIDTVNGTPPKSEEFPTESEQESQPGANSPPDPAETHEEGHAALDPELQLGRMGRA